ncbi:Rossmann-like and DUF2520 domain-containing protein [Gilvibacter sediminis]|uniref:Rossmann-like and DUF2520 domain-containing protein n=1 Tax=Gilvibacter sediminis TaxID=379071 RepID=UPI00235049D5|nr:Rossmann-like and DUF2520 domain-containing protein [Gilvibacter sediminis]MDC7998192.1 DUF2520 domain-containing protein [Gilvibacter sediminis]
MIKLALVGSGNLAHHLYESILNLEEIQLVGVLGRNPETLASFDADLTTTDPKTLPAADLTIIAVSDDAIEAVSKKLQEKHGLLAHTSGAQTLNAIKGKRKAVCYPLQTFSKTRTVVFESIPFCLEAECEEDYELLERFCGLLTTRVVRMNSKDRKYLHLAAVYVNNFVNQLYQTAHEILEDRELPFDLLHPLILETAKKVMDNRPTEVQTGPAKRGDQGIIDAHLSIQSEANKELYTLLTQAIQNSQNT